jgi:outer membrane protein OmpA-like peptidoglycan-associated protein/tetratricopeptide (TPR) repeat protein
MQKIIQYRLYLIIIYLLINPIYSLGQNKYYSKSKKAIKNFETAFQHYNLKEFEAAKENLIEAINTDKQFIDAYILFGEIATEENQKDTAIFYYLKAISIKSDYNPLMYLRLADLQKETGKYSEAIKNYQIFISNAKKKIDYSSYVNLKLKQCNFALELMKNPVAFNPVNIGPEINTKISEYWPSLTADDSMLVFTSSDREINSQEDLYFSIKQNGKWLQAKKFDNQINTNQSEGAQTISADGKTMIFTACLRKDGLGSCDLYWSQKKGSKWSIPINMGSPINSGYKETQPCLSSNGKVLYFVSNRPGGKGKFDIWMSMREGKNRWGQPINLGDSINTTEDENSPFVHYDNQTIYFSSEGHQGMGGSDLFISKKNIKGEWQKASNLGYPINTCYNEESIVITANGNLGLISTNIKGTYGQKDIYQFLTPPLIRPNKVIFIKGKIFDAKTFENISAEIDISNSTGTEIFKTESDEISGEFLICLSPQNNYAFNVNKPGYMMYSENYFLNDSGIYIKIPLQRIEQGSEAILKNIFFELNSYQLKTESFAELDKMIDFINLNKLRIQIQGHTDNQGTESYNQKLSENRAKAVYEYLIKGGIDKKRLDFKGYGFSTPIADNNTREGQAKNRRTAFKIISKE